MATVSRDGNWKSVEGTVSEVRTELAADTVSMEEAMLTYDGTNVVAIYKVEG